MDKIDKKQQLRPSIFDRLFDKEPENQVETDKQRHQVVREMRESVRRDLEYLFNTRHRCLSHPAHCAELKHSLLTYGLPDLATINLATDQGRFQLSRQLEQAISHCEPRFKSVKVITQENRHPDDRTIRFRIDAVMYADPTPETIVFDSTLEPVTHTVDVKEV